MELKITHANATHARYFTKEVLEKGVGYVVSNENAVEGFFSFTFTDKKTATLNFPYCINKKAIQLALETFLKDYPNIEIIKSLSRQKLDDLGFQKQLYIRGGK